MSMPEDLPFRKTPSKRGDHTEPRPGSARTHRGRSPHLGHVSRLSSVGPSTATHDLVEDLPRVQAARRTVNPDVREVGGFAVDEDAEPRALPSTRA